MSTIPYENLIYLDTVNNNTTCKRFQNFDVMTQGGTPYIVTDGCDAKFRVTNDTSNSPSNSRGDLFVSANDASKVDGVQFPGWKGVVELPVGDYFSQRDYSLGDSIYLTDWSQGTCMRNTNYGSDLSVIQNGHSNNSDFNTKFNTDAKCQGKFSDAHAVYAANAISCDSHGYCSDQPDNNLYNYYIGVPTPADDPTIYPKLAPSKLINGKAVGESGTCKRGYNWGVKDTSTMWVGKNCHATFVDEYGNQTACPVNWKACSATSSGGGSSGPWCSYQVSQCVFSPDMMDDHKCDGVDCTKTYCMYNSQCTKTFCDSNPNDSRCTNVPCAGVDCTKTLCAASADCYATYCANNPTSDACTSSWYIYMFVFLVVVVAIYKFWTRGRTTIPPSVPTTTI